ncbi:hypothetical protein HGB07_06035 [Candidatus Roizmanbacteria bacterium]|nr:hypothetical protein [Candidatus Roizmanbacteria bacterium]
MTLSLPTHDALVQAMQGLPSTNKWDIVCSYTIDQLNLFLKDQYEADKLAKKIPQLKFDTDLPYIGAATMTVDLVFSEPILTFILGDSQNAVISMLITDGTFSITPKDTQFPTRAGSIKPKTYNLVATIPIKAITGNTITPQGQVIIFKKDEVADSSIYLHFSSAETSYRFDPPPEGENDSYLKFTLTELTTYFKTKVKEVDYALARINNRQPTSGLNIFTPQSFVFSVMGDNDCGVLSLYIQTVESNNPPGNTQPSFQPGDKSILPIPSTYTASIIISYDLIVKSFLIPQIKAAGFDVTITPAISGISGTLNLAKGFIVKTNQIDNIWNEGPINFEIEVNECDFTINSLNLTIKDNGILSLVQTVASDVNWEIIKNDKWSTFENSVKGSATGTLSLNKQTQCQVNKDGTLVLADIDISGSDFTLSITGSSGAFGLSIKDSFLNQKMKIEYTSSFHMALHGFDFFLATNLLAPGKQIIELDATVGSAVPHDFLIVGKVVQKQH